MVQEHRRALAAQEPEPREPELPAGRGEQVDAADDEVDLLAPVVDRHGELVRPVAAPIADEQVAALLERVLLLASQPDVVEDLGPLIHAHAPAVAVREGQVALATVP